MFEIISNSLLSLLLLLLLIASTSVVNGRGNFASTSNDIINYNKLCPRIFNNIFNDQTPIGKIKAGIYTDYPDITTISICVTECCKQKENCNIAFIFNEKCYHVKCKNNDVCLPFKHPNGTIRTQMVLVNPVSNEISWAESLRIANFNDLTSDEQQTDRNTYFNKFDTINDNIYDILPYSGKLSSTSSHEKYNNHYANFVSPPIDSAQQPQSVTNNDNDIPGTMINDAYILNDENDLQMDESRNLYRETNLIPCEISLENCSENEECSQLAPQSSQGICNCINGYARNEHGKCFKNDDVDIMMMVPQKKQQQQQQQLSLTKKQQFEQLQQEQQQQQQPNENYDGQESERIDNVADPSTPSSSSMVNKKQLIVSVVSKSVRLPEKEVTLSVYTVPDEKSTGDQYKYLWTLISQPTGAVNGTISDQTKDNIKLSNLSEGLYRFKVNVTGIGLYGEAYANVTVLPEKRINKAPEVIITPMAQTVKLPTSKAILDGSTSKDDDQIISWHWDLIEGPIGYQPVLPDTSTLQLNDLTAPGNYTFKLTVIDSDKIENSTTAMINVLKANDYPPEANAGGNLIIYLPNNNVTLNGSLSTDDHEIVAWEWTKDINDESKAVDMQNTRTPYLQLSNLEEGIYTFVLKVTDASNQSSTSKVLVFVKPPGNLPPVANAGGQNQTINLPQNWIILNGSKSTDDIKIIEYHWKQLSGPNTANILQSNISVTNATGLTIGHYSFELIVIDENKNNASDILWMNVVQEKNTAPVANAGGDQTITMPVNTIYLNGNKSNDDLQIVNYTWTREGSSLAIGTIVGKTDHEPILILTNIVPGRYVFKLTVTDAQGLNGNDIVSVIVHPDPLVLNVVELTFTISVNVLTQSEFESLEQKLLLLLGDNKKIHVIDLHIEQKTNEAVLIFYVENISADNQNSIMNGLDVEKLLIDKFWRDGNILGTTVSDIRTTVCQNQCSGHGICNAETRACMCETFWMPDVFYFWGIRQANCDWSILYVVIGVFVSFLFVSGICWGITCLCRRGEPRKLKSRTRPAKPQKYSLLGTQDDDVSSFTRSISISHSDTDSDVLFESNKTKPNGILRNSNHNNNNNTTSNTNNNNNNVNSNTAKNGQQKYTTTRLGRRIKA